MCRFQNTKPWRSKKLRNHCKEVNARYRKNYGTDNQNGLPELVYIATVFHGNKELAMEAIAAGQVERFTEQGQPWLRHASKQCTKESGNMWKEELSQFGNIDEEKAKALSDAIETMAWDLPKLGEASNVKAISAGVVPESAHEPLEDVAQATLQKFAHLIGIPASNSLIL